MSLLRTIATDTKDDRMQTAPQLIALWAIPRSRSTAFFRMMINRQDFVCIHEPCADIMDIGRVKMPDVDGGATIIASIDGVVAQLRLLAADQPVFVKETLEHDYPFRLDESFLASSKHVFIIRDPAAAISSHYRLKPHMRLPEAGYENMALLFDTVVRVTGTVPPVIDADDLIDDAHGIVKAFCKRLAIRYLPDALNWNPGDQAAWARSRGWHQDVARSNGFVRQPERRRDALIDHPVVRAMIDFHQPHYAELYRHRLVPTPTSVETVAATA